MRGRWGEEGIPKVKLEVQPRPMWRDETWWTLMTTVSMVWGSCRVGTVGYLGVVKKMEKKMQETVRMTDDRLP